MLPSMMRGSVMGRSMPPAIDARQPPAKKIQTSPLPLPAAFSRTRVHAGTRRRRPRAARPARRSGVIPMVVTGVQDFIAARWPRWPSRRRGRTPARCVSSRRLAAANLKAFRHKEPISCMSFLVALL